MCWSLITEIFFIIGQKQLKFRFRSTKNDVPVFFLLYSFVLMASIYSLFFMPDSYLFPPSTLSCFLFSEGLNKV